MMIREQGPFGLFTRTSGNPCNCGCTDFHVHICVANIIQWQYGIITTLTGLTKFFANLRNICQDQEQITMVKRFLRRKFVESFRQHRQR